MKRTLKRIIGIVGIMVLSLSMVACNMNQVEDEGKVEPPEVEEKQTVKINSLNAEKTVTELEVPYKPERIIVFDMAALDTIDALGYGDNIVGMAKNVTVDYLSKYNENENIKTTGTLHEPDMEALMSVEPDIIFIGGRMAPLYDEVSKIAPVVYLGIDYEEGTFDSVKNNVSVIGKIFGEEEKIAKSLIDYEERINKINEFGTGKSAVIGLITSSSMNTLGNKGRASIITTDGGFNNIAENIESTHGVESSFELLVDLDPEYLFILDRDTAISEEGAPMAEEVIENELVYKTQAYKNENIYFLSPQAWYLAEGGLQATDIMLSDLELMFE